MPWLDELKRRNVIRIALAYFAGAWLLVQFADIVLPAFGFGDDAVRVMLIVLAIGVLPTLALAWLFELTPEGIRRDVDTPARSRSSGQRLDRVIILLMALALGVFAIDEFVLEQRGGTASGTYAEVTESDFNRRVAVLPFVAMSSGEDDSYFADGLTEEIINSLSALPELLVTARTSAFHFKATSLTIPEIATVLGVGHVVEGSVRRDGERVRITAQLVRASDGFHHWSQTYDRTLDDIFAIQEDIAESVAEVLDVALDPDDRERMQQFRIPNVEAFIAYQKGLELFVDAHVGLDDISPRLAEANVYFDEALEQVPELAQARVLKADYAGHVLFEIIAGYREPEHPDAIGETLAQVRAEYSQAIDQTPPGAGRSVFEAEQALFSDRWTTLPAKLDRALQPGDCRKINWISSIAGPFGWADEMVEVFRAAQDCDPLNVVSSFMLPWALVWAGNPQEALVAAETTEQLGIRHRWLEEGRITALRVLGRLDEAENRLHDNFEPEAVVMLQMRIDAQRGDPTVAERYARFLESPRTNDHEILMLAAAVGDRERANAAASRIDSRDGSAFVLAETIFQCFCGAPFELEATPNFRARLDESGLPWPPASPIRYPAKDW